MTPDESAELMDLYLDDALPEALRRHVEASLAASPEAQRDVHSLRLTVSRLHSAPVDRPDNWFIERTLDRLLQEHAGAQAPDSDIRIHTH